MLVDNAIVVLESIFRCREEGDDMIAATIRGTGEVGGAVVASTLTTVAVFFPIVFVEGVAGQIFGDMALTVVFSLVASLGVALFFIPMLASRQVHLWRGDGQGDSTRLTGSAILQLRSVAWFERGHGGFGKGAKTRSSTTPRIWARWWGRVPLGFVYVVGEYGGRALWIAAALGVVALKATVALLAVALFPIIYPGWWFYCWLSSGPPWREDARRLWAGLCAWAQGRDLFGSAWVRLIWDDLLAFVAPQNLGRDLGVQMRWTARAIKQMFQWALRGAMGLRVLKIAPALVGAVGVSLLVALGPVYFIFRFLIFMTLMVLGKTAGARALVCVFDGAWSRWWCSRSSHCPFSRRCCFCLNAGLTPFAARTRRLSAGHCTTD